MEEEEENSRRTRHDEFSDATSELCALAKGVSRQPEGVTPAYSYAGSDERRKRRGRETRRRFCGKRDDNVAAAGTAWKMCSKTKSPVERVSARTGEGDRDIETRILNEKRLKLQSDEVLSCTCAKE